MANRAARSEYPNGADWWQAVIAKYGTSCQVTGCVAGPVEIDHIIPRAQGGLNDVDNGCPLCREHHRRRTANELKIAWSWLQPDQLAYLADHGWVEWDADGQPFGRGWRHFLPRPVGGVIPSRSDSSTDVPVPWSPDDYRISAAAKEAYFLLDKINRNLS